MPRPRKRVQLVRLFHLLAGLSMLASSGCLAVAAGAAVAGGAVGYAYYKGNVAQEYAADPGLTAHAAKRALADLKLPLISEQPDREGGTLSSMTGDGQDITITFEPRFAKIPSEGSFTRVNVRVGLFGDQEVSDRIHAHIAESLTTTRVVPLQPPVPIQPVSAAHVGSGPTPPPRPGQPPSPPGTPIETGPPPLLPGGAPR